MDENIKALVEELETIIDSHSDQEFVRYLLIVAQIMDLLPISFEWKQDILYALLLQGEILELERVNRSLNSHFKHRVEGI
jgi:hypothetical protein